MSSEILMPAYSTLRQELLTNQCCPVPFGMSGSDLETVAQKWVRFLTLPAATKMSLFRKLRLPDRNMEPGYRDPARETDGMHDDKELFHYSDFTRRLFWKIAKGIPEAASFFEGAEAVLDAGKKSMRQTIETLEVGHPGVLAKVFPEWDETAYFHLRFLAYRNIKDGDVLAMPHYDRGIATQAIAESNPRLRMGKDKNDLRPYTHREGAACFFGGLAFPWFTGDDALVGGVHDVFQEGDPYSEDVARWSMVLFTDTHPSSPMPKIVDGVDTKM